MATQTEYQKKIRQKAIPAVYTILFRTRGEILLMMRQNTGYQDGNWDLPSGHMEEGELPSLSAAREATEEVGIVLDHRDLVLVHTSYRPEHDKTGNRIDLFFMTRHWSGEPEIGEPEKCSEIRWVNRFDLPDNMVPHVYQAICHWRTRNFYSELGVDWLKARGLYKL